MHSRAANHRPHSPIFHPELSPKITVWSDVFLAHAFLFRLFLLPRELISDIRLLISAYCENSYYQLKDEKKTDTRMSYPSQNICPATSSELRKGNRKSYDRRVTMVLVGRDRERLIMNCQFVQVFIHTSSVRKMRPDFHQEKTSCTQ